MLRILAVAGLCLMSSACIAVGSRTPLFSTTDAGNAPQPRPGLWASPDPDCQFDPSAPATGWPSCANGTVVRAHVIGPPADAASLMDYVLASGDPRVMQMPWPRAGKKDGPRFAYLGVRPTKFDEQGRFTVAKVWIALCGEQTPPPKDLGSDKKPPAPDNFQPIEGLDWHKGDDFCLADSKEKVRNAIKASEAWTGDPTSVEWVRDSEN